MIGILNIYIYIRVCVCVQFTLLISMFTEVGLISYLVLLLRKMKVQELETYGFLNYQVWFSTGFFFFFFEYLHFRSLYFNTFFQKQ